MVTKEEIKKMIAMYGITRQGENLGIRNRPKTESELNMLKAAKPEILATLLRWESEEEAKKIAAKRKVEEERRAIRAGEIKVRASWTDGEYLQAWQAYGEAGVALAEVGAAKYIDGWGYRVQDEIVKALGQEFTVPQAAELTRPAREAAKAVVDARETERAAKFAEAKKTGVKVLLRTWSEDCNDPAEQCSLDIVSEYAMPDGTAKRDRQHTW